MSALDDALNSAAPVFVPPTLEIGWKERPADEGDKPGENLSDMSDVLEGSFEIGHSFDDALPDPVTMTGSNDAVGTLKAPVLGRPELKLGAAPVFFNEMWHNADTGTAEAYTGLNGSTLPGDYVVSAIVLPSPTIEVSLRSDPGEEWTRIAKVSSSTHTMFVYGREAYKALTDAVEGPYYYLTEAIDDPVWSTYTFRAQDPSGNSLMWRPKSVVTAVDGGSSASHVLPAVTGDKGIAIGIFFGGPSLVWSSTGAGTERGDSYFTTSSLMWTQTDYFDQPGSSIVMSANSTSATAASARVGFLLELVERPVMTPTQFWSPFNKSSPVLGFDRDTANVDFAFNTVTDDGVSSTPLFSGLMQDVALSSGQSVELSAVSKTRINLNRSLTLPLVTGRRESLTVDWIVSWLLMHADLFIGTAVSPYTRFWASGFGSVHGEIDAKMGYNYGQYWDTTTTGGPTGIRDGRLGAVSGPNYLGMFACSTQNYTQEIIMNPLDLHRQSLEDLPPFVGEQNDAVPLQSQFAWSGAAGRISFWLKGDTSVPNGANVSPSDNYVFQYLLQAVRGDGYVLGRVWLRINNSRQFSVQMGNGTAGYGTVNWASPTWDLPSDGNWHFYSISWSWWDGAVNLLLDGASLGSTYWDTNGFITYDGWVYDTDEEIYAVGGRVDNLIRTHMPIAEVIIESAYEVYEDNFADVWPAARVRSFSAIARPSFSPVNVTPSDEPVNGWDTLSELARNVMAMYRANEGDGFEFLPPTYFGETAQLTATTVADTEVNAQDLAVAYDPSQSRNVVTLNFIDTQVDLGYSTVLAVQSAVSIPPGLSTGVFTLDVPVGELHGASSPHAAWWTLTNLTSTQITAGTRPNNVHFMTLNTNADGTGVVLAANSVTAYIDSYTQTTITIIFNNKTGVTQWMVNNYQGDNQLPFLQILGYAVRESQGYVTERDGGSIGTRRERALSADMNWIHDRPAAQRLASWMVTALARPRAVMTVVVQGDPRREPGQVVTVADAQDTQADGLWRILSVTHQGNGPQFTQTLQLMSVGTVAVWDSGAWDETTWGV